MTVLIIVPSLREKKRGGGGGAKLTALAGKPSETNKTFALPRRAVAKSRAAALLVGVGRNTIQSPAISRGTSPQGTVSPLKIRPALTNIIVAAQAMALIKRKCVSEVLGEASTVSRGMNARIQT